VEKLKSEGLAPVFHQLDILSNESIQSLKEYLQKTYGGLDILINNAGIAYKVNILYCIYIIALFHYDVTSKQIYCLNAKNHGC